MPILKKEATFGKVRFFDKRGHFNNHGWLMSGTAARNVAVSLVTQLISWVLTFAVTLFLPRYVGDIGLGKLTFASSLVSVFGVIVPLGLSTVLVMEIARDRNRTAELIASALVLRLPLGISMMALAFFGVWLLHYPPITQVLVFVGGLGLLVGMVNDVLYSAHQGREDMTRQSRATLVDKFLAAALILGLIFYRAPLWCFAAVPVITGLVAISVNLQTFGPLLRQSLAALPSLPLLKSVARAGLPFLGWAVFQTLYGQTDPLILSLISGDAAVGWYAVASRLVGTTLFLPAAVTAALLPTLSRLQKEDPDAFAVLSQRMLALVMLGGVPLALLLVCVPDLIFSLLHYPNGFTRSVPVLRIGGFGVLFWYAAQVVGTAVIASNGQNRMCRAAIAATVLGVPACFASAFIGHHYFQNGAAGAMFADVITEGCLVFAYLRFLPPGFWGKSAPLLAKYVVAAVPMTLILLFLEPHLKLWAALPAALVYVGMCALLRCFDAEYIFIFRRLIASRQAKG